MSAVDAALEMEVSAALEKSPYLASRQLRFETAEGRVVLRGVVASYYQKQMAQETLRRVSGERRPGPWGRR